MLFPDYVSAQSNWSAVALHTFRKLWREGGGADGMVIPLTVLAARITHWAVGRRRFQPRVPLYASHWAATTRRWVSAFYKHVTTSLRNPVSLEWSCGVFLWWVGWFLRWLLYHWRNQMIACFSAYRESGSANTRGALRDTAWRNARMSAQFYAILTIALRAVTSFTDLILDFSLSLSFSEPMSSSTSDSYAAFYVSYSLILLEKIFNSASSAVSLLVTTVYIRNGGRRMALLDSQLWSFFDLTRFLAAAQRRISVVGGSILLSFLAKAWSMSTRTMVSASRDPTREKAVAVFQGTCF